MSKVQTIDGIKPLTKEEKSKWEFKKLIDAVKQTIKNVESFVTAVSLVIVAGYAFNQAYQHQFAIKYAREAILFCSLLIAVQGAHLLWQKHINKR